MFEQTNPQDARAVPAAHYAELYASRQPPAGVRVWMSAYVPVHPGVYYHDGLAVTPRRGMPEPDGCNVYGSTFTAGRVVFQVFGSTVDELADLQTRWPEGVDQLWPYRAAFTWTPAPALDDAGLQWFAQGIYQELCALTQRVVR